LQIEMKRISCCLTFVLILALLPTVVLHGQSGEPTGSFAFTFRGFTVQGQLADATIHPDDTVTVVMILDDTLQTPVGPVPISGIGEWNGTVRNDSSLSGTFLLSGIIENATGTVRVCVLFFCGDANYVAHGTWEGELSGTQGTGTFQGVITFVSSPLPQIPVNKPIALSGTWSSTFQLPS